MKNLKSHPKDFPMLQVISQREREREERERRERERERDREREI